MFVFAETPLNIKGVLAVIRKMHSTGMDADLVNQHFFFYNLGVSFVSEFICTYINKQTRGFVSCSKALVSDGQFGLKLSEKLLEIISISDVVIESTSNEFLIQLDGETNRISNQELQIEIHPTRLHVIIPS